MPRPNILYIMADDHAANAVSCYGSRLASVFQTPNIDRLGSEGVRLNEFFSTNAICTPARASILTGQYGHVNGVRTLDDRLAPGYRPCLPGLLQEAGYRTALFGKWHLHGPPEGFDECQYLSGAGGQGTYQDPEFADNKGQVRRHEGYVTDLITDMCLDWLQRDGGEQPFFLMCHHKAPHDFWEYAPRHEDLLYGVKVPVPETLFEDRMHRSEASREYGSSVTPRSRVRSLYADFCDPDYVTGPLKGTENLTFEDKGLAAYQKYLKDYLRTVAAIDESVGALLDELEAQGILDETLVVYTSDQGMFLGEHDYQDKRWSYEESLRAPFLARLSAEITAGAVPEAMMANIDIAPTLLDYAGVAVPEAMQGMSCRRLLAGDAGGGRDEVYFRYWMHLAHGHDNPAHFGLRTREWKLIFYYGLALDAAGAVEDETPAGWELYDMLNDPYELRNLYGDPEYDQVTYELKRRLKRVREGYGDTDEGFLEVEKRMESAG